MGRASGTYRNRFASASCVALLCTCIPPAARDAHAQTPSSERLSGMSLDSLLNVRVHAAARYEQAARTAAASLTIVTADEITSRGYRTLIDALEDVPGFYATYDRDYSFVGARGFSRPTDYNNRVLVLLNGHRLNEGLYHSSPVGNELGVSLRGIERIEIVRGPGSALYGTSAMFAVVNLVTRTGADLDGGHIGAELGSFGRRAATLEAGNRYANGFDLAVLGEVSRTDGANLYFSEFDDPSTNNGIADGLDWDNVARVATVASFRGFGLTARYSTREKGVPTASWGTNFNDRRARTEGNWGGVELQYAHQLFAAAELSLRTYYDRYQYRGSFPGASAVFRNATDANAAGFDAQFNWDLSAAYRLTLGSELTRQLRADYHAWDDDARYVDADFPYTITSGYAQLEAHVSRTLALIAGLRHDDYEFAGTSTTPRLALIVTPDERTVVKLLWGEAFRAPNVYEQFVVNGSMDAAELDAEKIRTWELTAERRLGRNLLAQAAVYRYDVDRLIDQLTGETEYDVWFANRGHVRATGAELGLVRRGERLQTTLSYSHGAAKDTETGQRMSNSPAHLLKGAATLLLPGSVQATWVQRVESERLTVQGTSTGAFTLTNLTLRRPQLVRGAGLAAQVRNLFDTRYATPGGYEHRQASLQQDGRVLTLRVEWAF